jgi:hypothetical protein
MVEEKTSMIRVWKAAGSILGPVTGILIEVHLAFSGHFFRLEHNAQIAA